MYSCYPLFQLPTGFGKLPDINFVGIVRPATSTLFDFEGKGENYVWYTTGSALYKFHGAHIAAEYQLRVYDDKTTKSGALRVHPFADTEKIEASVDMQIWDGNNKKVCDGKNTVWTFTKIDGYGYFLPDCTGDLTIRFTFTKWNVFQKQ